MERNGHRSQKKTHLNERKKHLLLGKKKEGDTLRRIGNMVPKPGEKREKHAKVRSGASIILFEKEKKIAFSVPGAPEGKKKKKNYLPKEGKGGKAHWVYENRKNTPNPKTSSYFLGSALLNLAKKRSLLRQKGWGGCRGGERTD